MVLRSGLLGAYIEITARQTDSRRTRSLDDAGASGSVLPLGQAGERFGLGNRTSRMQERRDDRDRRSERTSIGDLSAMIRRVTTG